MPRRDFDVSHAPLGGRAPQFKNHYLKFWAPVPAEIIQNCLGSDQARNQLGTPGKAKNFLKGAPIF